MRRAYIHTHIGSTDRAGVQGRAGEDARWFTGAFATRNPTTQTRRSCRKRRARVQTSQPWRAADEPLLSAGWTRDAAPRDEKRSAARTG